MGTRGDWWLTPERRVADTWKEGGGHLGGALVVEEGVEPDAGLEARGAAAEHTLEDGDELAERRGQPPARLAQMTSGDGAASSGRRSQGARGAASRGTGSHVGDDVVGGQEAKLGLVELWEVDPLPGLEVLEVLRVVAAARLWHAVGAHHVDGQVDEFLEALHREGLKALHQQLPRVHLREQRNRVAFERSV